MKQYTKQQGAMLMELITYSDRYEIQIQFWPDQTAVFVEKDGVELTSYGGDFNHAVKSSIEYLERINKKPKAATA